MLGLPAPFVPHSASLSPAIATRVLSALVPVSAPLTNLDECLFSISLVLVPLAVRFSVSSGCARRRSVSTYAAILVLPPQLKFLKEGKMLAKNEMSTVYYILPISGTLHKPYCAIIAQEIINSTCISSFTLLLRECGHQFQNFLVVFLLIFYGLTWFLFWMLTRGEVPE